MQEARDAELARLFSFASVPYPVITTTGSSGWLFFIREAMSSPSMPGIRRSVNTMS